MLFSGIRMSVGAAAVIYLLAHGVSRTELDLMKTFQAMVVCAAELPLAYCVDCFSRKSGHSSQQSDNRLGTISA